MVRLMREYRVVTRSKATLSLTLVSWRKAASLSIKNRLAMINFAVCLQMRIILTTVMFNFVLVLFYEIVIILLIMSSVVIEKPSDAANYLQILL